MEQPPNAATPASTTCTHHKPTAVQTAVDRRSPSAAWSNGIDAARVRTRRRPKSAAIKPPLISVVTTAIGIVTRLTTGITEHRKQIPGSGNRRSSASRVSILWANCCAASVVALNA